MTGYVLHLVYILLSTVLAPSAHSSLCVECVQSGNMILPTDNACRVSTRCEFVYGAVNMPSHQQMKLNRLWELGYSASALQESVDLTKTENS